MAAAAVFGVAAPQAAEGSASIPVAARALAAGTLLAAEDVTQADTPLRNIYQGTPRTAAEVVGKRLSRNLHAGDAFNTLTLKAVNSVERNSRVTVLFNRPGVQLVGQALALESGNEGSTVRVQNTDSRTTLVATVTAPGTVTIGDLQ